MAKCQSQKIRVCRQLKTGFSVSKKKAQIALNGTPMTELRDVTCHMGSRCYLLPDISNPSPQEGTLFTYPGGMKG